MNLDGVARLQLQALAAQQGLWIERKAPAPADVGVVELLERLGFPHAREFSNEAARDARKV